MVGALRKWIFTTVFAFALVGSLYVALLEDSAIGTATKLDRDSERPLTEAITIEATVESLRDGQFDASSSELAPLVMNWREPLDLGFPLPQGSPLENYQ